MGTESGGEKEEVEIIGWWRQAGMSGMNQCDTCYFSVYLF